VSDLNVIVKTLQRALPEDPIEAVDVVEQLKKLTSIAVDKKLRDQQQWIATLEEDNTVLKRQNEDLESRVTQLVAEKTSLHQQLEAARN
jgi:hypothetical protein